MKNALINIQNEMYDKGIRGHFTPEENMHLTLAFIGDYPDPLPVTEALEAVAFTPFDLALEGLGCYGDLWWAGVKDSAPLEAVVRRIRRALADNGIPFDRKKFSPHITLIRKARGEMPGVRPETAAMTVNRISLMRSDRGKNGMIYTEVGELLPQSLRDSSLREGAYPDLPPSLREVAAP